MKPNFIIIGAARSGTTSLFKYLECHPDIFMSEIKEINFFSNEKYWRKGLSWYENHFKNAGQKLIGEASTSYTSAPSLPNVPERMRKCLGDVKLIYIVRDPIDRFISHFLHRVDRGVESRLISKIIDDYSDDSLLLQGRYYYQLNQFLKHFNDSDIHLLSIDELKNDTTETIASIYKFLGVDHTFSGVDCSLHHNVNSKVTRKNWFGKAVLNFYHTHVEQVAYPYQFKKFFLNFSELGSTEINKDQLCSEYLEKLIAYYREDIKLLQSYSPIDMGSWRNYD